MIGIIGSMSGFFLISYAYFGGGIHGHYALRFSEPWLYTNLVITFLIISYKGTTIQKKLTVIFVSHGH